MNTRTIFLEMVIGVLKCYTLITGLNCVVYMEAIEVFIEIAKLYNAKNKTVLKQLIWMAFNMFFFDILAIKNFEETAEIAAVLISILKFLKLDFLLYYFIISLIHLVIFLFINLNKIFRICVLIIKAIMALSKTKGSGSLSGSVPWIGELYDSYHRFRTNTIERKTSRQRSFFMSKL